MTEDNRQQANAIDFTDFLELLLRKRILISGVVLSSLLFAVAYIFTQNDSEIYEARVVIQQPKLDGKILFSYSDLVRKLSESLSLELVDKEVELDIKKHNESSAYIIARSISSKRAVESIDRFLKYVQEEGVLYVNALRTKKDVEHDEINTKYERLMSRYRSRIAQYENMLQFLDNLETSDSAQIVQINGQKRLLLDQIYAIEDRLEAAYSEYKNRDLKEGVSYIQAAIQGSISVKDIGKKINKSKILIAALVIGFFLPVFLLLLLDSIKRERV